MKAKELRIGNIINQGVGSYGDCCISGYQLYQLTLKENGGSFAEYYNNFKPTTLTEEWLLKFGFYRENKEEWCDNNMILWLTFTNDGWYDNNLGLDIKHVHQLQNLYFALTNKELEI